MNSYKWIEIKQITQTTDSQQVEHCFPFAIDFRTALSVEKIIRDNGVVPATIGILKGKVRVGKYKS